MFDKFPNQLEAGHGPGTDWGRIAVDIITKVWFADPRKYVKSSKAGALVIGICAASQQVSGQFKVAIFDGQDQRTCALPRHSGATQLG